MQRKIPKRNGKRKIPRKNDREGLKRVITNKGITREKEKKTKRKKIMNSENVGQKVQETKKDIKKMFNQMKKRKRRKK